MKKLITKINYLAYMMIDNHVHFHVIPRYSKIKKFNEIEFKKKNPLIDKKFKNFG